MDPGKAFNIWLVTVLSAMAGGTLWAMANIFSIVFAPKPPSKREVTRALVGSLFALISSAFGGAIVAPWIVRHNGITDVETIALVGLFVGLGFWASVPLLIAIATKGLPGVFGNIGSMLSKAAATSVDSSRSAEGDEQ